MGHYEAVLISGVEQFAEYTGYASSFRFAGRSFAAGSAAKPAVSPRARVIAIDAINFARRLAAPVRIAMTRCVSSLSYVA